MRIFSCCLALMLVMGCKGPDSDDTSGTGADTDICGDIDGAGGDTGNAPNVLGNWTANYGNYEYNDGTCSDYAPELDDDDFKGWLTGNIEIKGRVPDQLYAIVDDNEDERFFGLENANGGIVFTGTHQAGDHTIYASFGGLLYEVPQVDRSEIRGFGMFGLDVDSGDQVVDCFITGDFVAKKSGV